MIVWMGSVARFRQDGTCLPCFWDQQSTQLAAFALCSEHSQRSDGLGKTILGMCLPSVHISFCESCLACESPALTEPGSDTAFPDSFTRQTMLPFMAISVLFCVLLIYGPDEPPRCPFESCSAHKHLPESTHRGTGLAVFTLCWGNGAHQNLQVLM